ENNSTIDYQSKKIVKQETATLMNGYVDLGLPSGTKWKSENETNSNSGDEFFTYDEAVAKFGSNLPTKKQLEELKNSCKWDWQGNGYKVTGHNGNYIILPASDYSYCVNYVDTSGKLWSSSPIISDYTWSLYSDSGYAWGLYFGLGGVYMGIYHCCGGLSVRLVQE
ncbi:MAG: hypothetical protein J5606_00625, partial [Bacteroidales bacterium]|nr:hypothetical protein [Bacteroidales bacterium]